MNSNEIESSKPSFMNISAHDKRLIFNKGEDEPLNADEQAVWDDWASGNAERNSTPNINAPRFLDQLRAYVQASKDKKKLKKSIKRMLFRQRINKMFSWVNRYKLWKN